MSTTESIISIDFHFSGLAWNLRCGWWEAMGVKHSPFWPFTLILNIYIVLDTTPSPHIV